METNHSHNLSGDQSQTETSKSPSSRSNRSVLDHLKPSQEASPVPKLGCIKSERSSSEVSLNPESKSAEDGVKKFFQWSPPSNNKFNRPQAMFQDFKTGDKEFSAFANFQTWLEMHRSHRELLKETYKSLYGQPITEKAQYLPLATKMFNALVGISGINIGPSHFYNSFVPSQLVGIQSLPPIPIDQDVVFSHFQLYTSTAPVRASLTNVFNIQWIGQLSRLEFDDMKQGATLRCKEINRGDALNKLAQCFYEAQMIQRFANPRQTPENVQANAGNHFKFGIAMYVNQLIQPVWQILCTAPTPAAMGVQNFLEYCLAITTENAKYEPVILALLTGTFIFNYKAHEAWCSALDYCLNAFNDIILRVEYPTIDYSNLAKFTASYWPDENKSDVEEVMRTVQPKLRALMNFQMNLSAVKLKKDKKGLKTSFLYETGGYNLNLTEFTRNSLSGEEMKDTQITVLYQGTQENQASVLVVKKLGVFQQKVSIVQKHWTFNSTTYYIKHRVSQACWLFEYARTSSTHNFQCLQDSNKKTYKMLDQCFCYPTSARSGLYSTLKAAKVRQITDLLSPGDLLEDLRGYLMAVHDNQQFEVYMTDLQQYMTFRKQIECCYEEVNMWKLCNDEDQSMPTGSKQFTLWTIENGVKCVVQDCLPICLTIEHVMTVRYLLLAERIHQANKNDVFRYDSGTFSGFVADKLDAQADDQFVVEFIQQVNPFTNCESPSKTASNYSFAKEPILQTPQFQKPPVNLANLELPTGNMIGYQQIDKIPVFASQDIEPPAIWFKSAGFDSLDLQSKLQVAYALKYWFIACKTNKSVVNGLTVQPNQFVYDNMQAPDCDLLKYFVFLAENRMTPLLKDKTAQEKAEIFDKAVAIFRKATKLTDDKAFTQACDYYDEKQEYQIRDYLTK